MAINENQSKNNTRRIYIRSQRRWQEVPEEIYREHTRFHDTYRHRMQDRGLCCCPRNKWWVCDADCLTCEYRNADVIASLDSPIGEEDDDLILMDTIANDSVAVSELAADRIVLEQLFKRLADLMPEAADIGKLRMQGLSDEAIAKSIGIPRTTFLSRIKTARKQLEEGIILISFNVVHRSGLWENRRSELFQIFFSILRQTASLISKRECKEQKTSCSTTNRR